MAFDSDLAPIVGKQVTLTNTSGTDVDVRVNLRIERANVVYYTDPDGVEVRECDLIVKGVVDGDYRGWLNGWLNVGWLNVGGNDFQSDKAADAVRTRADLEDAASVTDQPLTFTCVPPGSGRRMGLDRAGDRLLDGNDAAPAAVKRGCRVSPSTPSERSSYGLLFVVIEMFARRSAIGRRQRY